MKKLIGLTLGTCLLATGCGSGPQNRAGEFAATPGAPPGFEKAGGTATLKSDDSGTTVRITLKGLIPDTEYMSHVHEAPCSESEPGGGHYKFDPDGPDRPPNEIHLKFRSKSDGTGTAEATNPNPADDAAHSVVLHIPDAVAPADRVLCADLT